MDELKKLLANKWVVIAAAVAAYWAWKRSPSAAAGATPGTGQPNQQLPAEGKSTVGMQAVLTTTPKAPWE